jgi:hypothetical protein
MNSLRMYWGWLLAFALFVGTWFGLAALLLRYGCYEDLAKVGGSLSPLGWILTGMALLFAFNRQSTDQQQAHRDRLAAAYTNWFREAWPIATKLVEKAQAAHLYMTHAEFPPKYDPNEAKKAVDEIHAFEPALRIAAAPVLMLERDAAFSKRLNNTWTSFPSFDKPYHSSNIPDYVVFVGNLLAVVLSRRDEVEALFWDAVTKISAQAPTIKPG